jgi:hypothetical protein
MEDSLADVIAPASAPASTEAISAGGSATARVAATGLGWAPAVVGARGTDRH